jgi:hypothetical protein
LIEASSWLAGVMGKDLPGMLSRAGNFPGKLSSTNRAASSNSA